MKNLILLSGIVSVLFLSSCYSNKFAQKHNVYFVDTIMVEDEDTGMSITTYDTIEMVVSVKYVGGHKKVRVNVTN